MTTVEGRNPVIECLTRARRRVHRVYLDRGAQPDRRVTLILELAERAEVRVDRVSRQKLDQLAGGRVHNGVVATADPLPSWTTKQLLDESGSDPFLVLVAEVSYEHNLGAILRSALGFGVSGLIIPSRRGAEVSPVVQRVSMGGCEEVPVVRDSMTSALKHIRKAGIPVVGAAAGGQSVGQARLQGPLALLMGGEAKGLTDTLVRRCDAVVGIPLAGSLESLNQSVAAALLMYEKRRQDDWFKA